MIIKSQSPWGQKALSMAINWPVPPRASANSRSSSLRDKEMCSHFPRPPVLMRGKQLAQSWALQYAECLQFTQFSSAHTGLPSHAASSMVHEMQRSFRHFGHHQFCPKKAHIAHCSLGEVTKWARASEYPQTSPDWVYQLTYYYLRNFLKETGLQNHKDLMLHL